MGEVGAAVGLASYPLHAAEREPLLVAAERAMRSAKRVGRNSVRVAEPEAV
jgi:GGDEF domain-containing protein